MKYLKIISFFLSLFSTDCFAQNNHFGAGEYAVDSIELDKLCEPRGALQYYSLKTKHPKSSAQLLTEVKAFYKKNTAAATQSGFLTIRFIINCKGEPCAFKFYEIDENDQERPFDTSISAPLLGFTKQLGGWKSGEHKGKTYNYYTYFCFKIKNGDIENIVP